MNPMQMITKLMGSNNPMQMMRQLAAQNPTVGRAVQMLDGKTPEQMKQMAYNMCREMGTTPERVAQNLGLRL